MQMSAMGECLLVGAGPGDPELLTLKAVKAIARATVVLVDDLVNDEVLVHASPTARIVHVGKRGGCKSTPQAFIEKLMAQEAQNGEIVVRLKGGDPSIFGRLGEELAYLRSAGVPVTIVNGISSGVMAATALMAPLTHRDYAHGVVLLTGHAAPGQQELNWAQIAQLAHAQRLTLAIYMGVKGVAGIQSGLLQSLPGDTPVALVQSASLPHERRVVTTLAQLVDVVREQGIASPAIILVGDVLKASAVLQQYGDGYQFPHIASTYDVDSRRAHG
nr:uroporphyrinogen-III C-methyltransferase [Lampropedia puyangensis]